MPVTIEFADEGRGVVLRAAGLIAGEDLVSTIDKFVHRDEKAFSTISYWYSDYSGVQGSDVTSDQIRRIAEISVLAARINPRLVVAVCAPRALTYGLSRMWEMLADQNPWLTRVFRDDKDARKWLRSRLRQDLSFGAPAADEPHQPDPTVTDE